MFFLGIGKLCRLNRSVMRYNLRYLRYLHVVVLLLLSVVVLYGQTLTLYTIPPPHPYKWRSPNSLLISTIRNYYAKTTYRPRRILGHMVIELKKDSSLYLTGMVSDEMASLKNSILTEKIGLGVLFKVVKGHLEESSDVQSELKMRTQSAQAAFIRFNISDSAYQYLLSYIDSFKVKGYDKLYNGLNVPRAGKGCGCTAFGISFLELINALDPEYRNRWAVEIKVPQKLIGDTRQHKKVSLWSLFFAFNWAKGKQKYNNLLLYEPYLIYKWINRVWENELDNQKPKYQLITSGKARGLLVDCTTCSPVTPMFPR